MRRTSLDSLLRHVGQTHHVAVLSVLALLGACEDSDYYVTEGPTPPRLTAALVADAPGAPIYTARILVEEPVPSEYVGVLISGGAKASFAGGSEATAFCVRATREQTYEIVSTLGTPRLTVKLGKWSGTDGALPPDDCADQSGFEVIESVIVSIPSATVPEGTLDAGADLDAAPAADAADAELDESESNDEDARAQTRPIGGDL